MDEQQLLDHARARLEFWWKAFGLPGRNVTVELGNQRPDEAYSVMLTDEESQSTRLLINRAVDSRLIDLLITERLLGLRMEGAYEDICLRVHERLTLEIMELAPQLVGAVMGTLPPRWER